MEVRARMRARDFAFGQDPKQHHEFLVTGRVRIGGAAEFRDPYGHVVVGEQRGHDGELVAVEDTLAGADHDRVEGAVRSVRVASRAPASGRRARGRLRLRPTSKYSAVIRP